MNPKALLPITYAAATSLDRESCGAYLSMPMVEVSWGLTSTTWTPLFPAKEWTFRRREA